MIRQTKTAIKELTAQYRSVLKKAFLACVVASATSGVANATITTEDIAAINNNINMQQSDGSYTTSKGDFNTETTHYDTVDGFGLYTYDHDNNPETDEIALTTNNGTETLDNSLFTFTDNNGNDTNLADNPSGFAAGDFTATAGTVDVADGVSSLTTLDTTTSVGLSNYQYVANFDNLGETLTTLTQDAPELSSFHNDITLTTGSITVNGDNESNKPSIDQYGFAVTLHDGSTGNFDLVYNESTHLYDYAYNGDVELDAADIAAAHAQVSSQSENLIADTTLFNNAVATNTSNYNSALGHYDAVHGVYLADDAAQTTLNTNYDNYTTSYGAAVENQNTASTNLSAAQGAYATDLAIYNNAKNAYENYENSLGKSIDTKDAAVLTSATNYADDQIAALENGAVATNAENIATNTADIATNAANIATNTTDIATNAANIATNTTDIATNTADIATNTANIATNTADIATNAANIAANASAIANETERATAAENALDERVSANTTNIATNAENIATNTADIATNTANIAANASAIADETERATAAENALRDDFARSDATTLKSANAYTDSKISDLEDDMSAGIASTAALSSVAVSGVKRGELSLGGGYGYYNNQSAVAFGATMGLTDNWSVNAGAGLDTNGSNVAFRAGTNYKFKLWK